MIATQVAVVGNSTITDGLPPQFRVVVAAAGPNGQLSAIAASPPFVLVESRAVAVADGDGLTVTVTDSAPLRMDTELSVSWVLTTTDPSFPLLASPSCTWSAGYSPVVGDVLSGITAMTWATTGDTGPSAANGHFTVSKSQLTVGKPQVFVVACGDSVGRVLTGVRRWRWLQHREPDAYTCHCCC